MSSGGSRGGRDRRPGMVRHQPLASPGWDDGSGRRTRERDRRARERRQRTVRRRAAALSAAVVLVAVALFAVASSGSDSPGTPAAGTGSASAGATNSTAGAHGKGSGSAGARPGTTNRQGSTAGANTRGTGVPGTRTVPILMYHVINPPPAGAPFPGLYVPGPEFADQVQALKSAGWHAVTMDQLQAYWTRGVPLGPGRPIVLTFDNGYDSQYTVAAPILKRAGWVGVENIQLAGLPKSQGGLTIDQVHGLLNDGWELDTQGISHADLIRLSPAALAEEVASARRRLRRRYHVPVNWFCYPSGHYDATVISEVKAAGYIGSTTVVPGWAAPGGDRYRLPRLRVLGGTSGAALLRQLAQYQHASSPPGSYGGA